MPFMEIIAAGAERMRSLYNCLSLASLFIARAVEPAADASLKSPSALQPVATYTSSQIRTSHQAGTEVPLSADHGANASLPAAERWHWVANAPQREFELDWRDVPVRVITSDYGSGAALRFREAGFNHVYEAVRETVNLRTASPLELWKRGDITPLARLALEDGRRRTYEFPSVGAVGAYLSHLAVCDPTGTTLVLEDDAAPQETLPAQLSLALKLQREEGVDTVVFGPIGLYQGMESWVMPSPPFGTSLGFETLGQRGFYGMQGVLWTARGCRQFNRFLGRPLAMQVDAQLSYFVQSMKLPSLDLERALNLVVETGVQSIVQVRNVDGYYQGRHTEASIQEPCCMCSMPASDCANFWTYLGLVAVSVILASFVCWIAWQAGRQSVMLPPGVLRLDGVLCKCTVPTHSD